MTQTTTPTIGSGAALYPNPMDVPVTVIATTDAAVELGHQLAAATVVAVDTETEVSDLKRRIGAWVATSVAARFPDGREQVWVLPMVDIDSSALAHTWDGLRAVAWNANFEREVFTRAGLRLDWVDLMLHQAVLDQGRHIDGGAFYASLAYAARHHLGLELGGKTTLRKSFRRDQVLSDEQISYAAQDAAVTLWLVDPLAVALHDAGLTRIAQLECGAQEFIATMTSHGFLFDADGWRTRLAQAGRDEARALTELAELTGGGQGNLFEARVEPSWNPASPADVRRILNDRAADAVRAYSQRRHGTGALFEPDDPIDGDTLAQIDHPVARTLLELRSHQKLLSTYGEKLLALLGPDGRFHPRYTQALVATGRLSSDNPNAQNLAPETRPFTLPAPGHVFVYADMSQAELRKLAQDSGDQALLEAFRRGEDVHCTTAGRMFGVDMDQLRVEDPDRYNDLRAKGKVLNFATVYGLGAAALAVKLTVGGQPTSTEEAAELLELYSAAYPQVAAWLAERDTQVEIFASQGTLVDWRNTERLAVLFRPVADAADTLLARGVEAPTDRLVAEELGALVADLVVPSLRARYDREPSAEEVMVASAKLVGWVRSFRGRVLVGPGLVPFSFESRTSAGRRRLFEVSYDEWVWSVLVAACRSRLHGVVRVRDQFFEAHRVRIGNHPSKEQVKKVFEDRGLRSRFLEVLLADRHAGPALRADGFADAVRAKRNMFRNAPIQGGVADAALRAFELLTARLGPYTGAVGVLSIHDSIIIEAPVAHAVAVRRILETTMAEALAWVCPDVPVKVDAELKSSLADTIDETALPGLQHAA